MGRGCQRARVAEDEAMDVGDAPEYVASILQQLAPAKDSTVPPDVEPLVPPAVKHPGGTAVCLLQLLAGGPPTSIVTVARARAILYKLWTPRNDGGGVPPLRGGV